jgi:hypothetical protein
LEWNPTPTEVLADLMVSTRLVDVQDTLLVALTLRDTS